MNCKFQKILYLYFRILLLPIVVILCSCANPLPPSGGPPDKTPPEVVETYPLNNTLNFNKKTVEITFSKYMDKTKVTENVFILPAKKTSYSWTGKTLYIDFDEKLNTNTTYSVNLGADLTDTKGNKPTDSYSLIFSTGNRLDSGRIRGKIFDKDPAGVNIFAYRIDNINPDTLNPRKIAAVYKTQAGSSGNFEIPALKDGKYRVIALRDKFKDGVYNDISDDFSASNSDVVVKQDTFYIIKMKIGPPVDKTELMLFDVMPKASTIFETMFNKDLDTTTVLPENFTIVDSAGKKEMKILSAYISLDNAKKAEIITKEKLDSNINWKLIVNGGLSDLFNNRISDTVKSKYFKSITYNDTTKPVILKFPLKDSTLNVNLNKNFRFVWNMPVKFNDFKSRLYLMKADKKDTLQIQIKWISENILDISSIKPFEPNTWYSFLLNPKNLKSENGSETKDTLFKETFKTIDTREFGGFSGIIKDTACHCPPYLVIITSKDNVFKFSTTADSLNKFDFPEIPAGTYLLQIISDIDKNGKYSFGEPFPYKFSEKFFIYDKEFEIKARWRSEDAVIVLPKE